MRARQTSERIRGSTQTLPSSLPRVSWIGIVNRSLEPSRYFPLTQRVKNTSLSAQGCPSKLRRPHPTSIRVRTMWSPSTPITARGRRYILRFCRRTERGQDRASPSRAGPGGLASEQKVRHGRLSGQKGRENPTRDAQAAANFEVGAFAAASAPRSSTRHPLICRPCLRPSSSDAHVHPSQPIQRNEPIEQRLHPQGSRRTDSVRDRRGQLTDTRAPIPIGVLAHSSACVSGICCLALHKHCSPSSNYAGLRRARAAYRSCTLP